MSKEYLYNNTTESGNCLLWTGPIKTSEGRRRAMARTGSINVTAPKFAYHVYYGIPFTESINGYVTNVCGNPLCVAKAHLVLVPKSDVMLTRRTEVANNLTAYLEARSSVDPDTGCWNWVLSVNPDGYGQAKVAGVTMRAHRLAYAAKASLTPAQMAAMKGVTVCHTCDNPLCVNPAHVYSGTPSSNMRDKVLRGRASGGGRAKLTDTQAAEIIRRYVAGETAEALAAVYGVTKQAVMYRIKAAGVSRPHLRHHAMKLTDDQVRAVYAEAYSGKGGVHDVCAAHGISLSSLRERARKLGLL